MKDGTAHLLGTRIAAHPPAVILDAILEAARQRQGGGVACCNVHMLMEARDHPDMRAALEGMAWVLPDSRPVELALRLRGHRDLRQMAGPDVQERLLAAAESNRIPVYFLSGSAVLQERLPQVVAARFPRLIIAGSASLPLQEWTGAEELAQVAAIERSGAGLCFIGIGCPKQELWIARNRSSTGAVLLGVGAAFDMLAGIRPRAPRWMQKLALEWVYRLCQEPRRLWRRYLVTNTRFLWLMVVGLWAREEWHQR